MGKARKMAAEFQGQFQEAMREAEMADLKKTFDEVKETATGFAGGNVMTSLQKDVGEALRIDDVDKPAVSTTDTPATSMSDAPAASAVDTPLLPTTPEPPIPETFTEADAHAAAMEPLAITREVQSQPAPQDITPSAPDVLKDAKAS
jgi:sec-independent protein translocase protein TatB